MVPLIGYVDRFSARPGETVAVKVSSELGDPYRADLVRIIHGDANPGGPGLKFEEVPASFAGIYRSRFQPVHSGSCGLVLPDKPIALPDPCTIVVRVQPWLLDASTADGAGDRARPDAVGHRRWRRPDAPRPRSPARRPDAEAALVRIADHRGRRPGAVTADRVATELGRHRLRRSGIRRLARIA